MHKSHLSLPPWRNQAQNSLSLSLSSLIGFIQVSPLPPSMAQPSVKIPLPFTKLCDLFSFKSHLSLPPMGQPSAKIPLPFTKLSDWLFNIYMHILSLSLSLDTINTNIMPN